MPNPEAERWNEKYQQESQLWLDMEPRSLLIEFISHIPDQGLALDAACGVGINAIFLAMHGLKVIGLDISKIALQLAKEKSRQSGCSVEFAAADLAELWLPGEYFDVITNFHFLEGSGASLPAGVEARRYDLVRYVHGN